MYRQKNEKIRLSIEKADKNTVRYLKEKLAKLQKEEREKNENEQSVMDVIRVNHLEVLLSGIHLLTYNVPEASDAFAKNFIIVCNNYIETLADEFPDLVLK